MAGLYNAQEDFAKAKAMLLDRTFHPWEGGEGKVVGQYLLGQLEMAKELLDKGDFQFALDLLHEASVYPTRLGEGKLYGAQENDIFYLQGLAYRGLGMNALAEKKFRDATIGNSDPSPAIFYNDAPPDKIFYQGLAWRQLGNEERAIAVFNRLLSFGITHMEDNVRIDYFAVSLPDLMLFETDPDLRNRVHCRYLKGLGQLGLGNRAEAVKEFAAALDGDINHIGARVHLRRIPAD
jgi:tetratricopeptide (TPR) repeat protein